MRYEIDLNTVTRAAVETLLWSESPMTDEDDTESFESHGYTPDDLAPGAVTDIFGAVSGFVQGADKERPYIWQNVAGTLRMRDGKQLSEWIGHNWVLTANRHGAGFWDTGIGDAGTYLTDLAHAASYSLYLGDDGRVYVS